MRKIILMAGKTCVVSLPKKWVQAQGIKKGDSVEVEEQQGYVRVLVSRAAPQGSSVAVDLTGTAPMTSRIIAALFKAGHDSIEATYSSAEELEAVHHVLHQGMLGFEIVHQGKKSVVLKKVSTAHVEEFDTLRNRLLVVVKSLAEESLEAVRTHDTPWLQALVVRDKEINRLSDVCRRMMSQQVGVRKNCQQYVIIEVLEKLADSYVSYCKTAQVHAPCREILELHKRTNLVVDLLIELLFSFSLPKAVQVGSEHSLLVRYQTSLPQKLVSEQVLLWFYLGVVQENVFDMLGSIIGAGIE